MDKIARERDSMIKQFGRPPEDEWYESIKLPVSWELFGGRIKGKLVLDIGCSTGWMTWWALKEGAEIVASDIFETNISPKLPFMKFSKEEIPFKDETFDFIITGNVLHHGDLNLSEIYRVLKKGGEFITVQEPCIDNKKDEKEYLEKYLKNELDLGLDEHRPSLKKYIKAFSSFSICEFYEMNDRMFIEPVTKILMPITGNNYEGGIAIKAIK